MDDLRYPIGKADLDTPMTPERRRQAIAEVEAALGELPPSQREVFLAHEIDRLSFADISRNTGVSVKTLLSRKHYAVKRLRKRLQRIYEESGYERRGK